MPTVDIVDETFLLVPPAVLAATYADPDVWRECWPDLRLEVYADRGEEGLRWTVTGALVGTQEVWLEPMLDGTLAHYFLRADPPPDRNWSPAMVRRVITARQVAAKAVSLRLKRTLEAGRRPGCPPPQ
ncbi:hypothetical protein [Sciscionella sediminilitoris]|uniref:hypothetical protein n=1 Tax=Sciscionella sediminilitoris TaxID=1445613 RepID=UPI0004DF37FC|nr:hypothetical protein [Sciscionella sp. SE31]